MASRCTLYSCLSWENGVIVREDLNVPNSIGTTNELVNLRGIGICCRTKRPDNVGSLSLLFGF